MEKPPINLEEKAKATIDKLRTTPKSSVDYTKPREIKQATASEEISDLDLRKEANTLSRKPGETRDAWTIFQELRTQRRERSH